MKSYRTLGLLQVVSIQEAPGEYVRALALCMGKGECGTLTRAGRRRGNAASNLNAWV